VETDATVTVDLSRPGPVGYFTEDELQRIGSVAASHQPHGYSIGEGDRVLVTSDEVLVKGQSTRGAKGFCTQVWEICETDPACCCAENAGGWTHRVQLDGQLDGQLDHAAETIRHYYAEEELQLISAATAVSGVGVGSAISHV